VRARKTLNVMMVLDCRETLERGEALNARAGSPSAAVPGVMKQRAAARPRREAAWVGVRYRACARDVRK
jgi:hypothetical protein